MDIFPIWRTVFWESEEDSITFRIMKWGTEEIYRARAARFPDTETLSVNLNKPCQNTLDSALFRTSPTGDTVELSNAYAEYSLQVLNPSNGEWSAEYQWAFVNDWSYAAHDGDVYSEPINGHAAAGQMLVYTCLCSSSTEEVCYDDYDIGPHIWVSPSAVTFDSTGGTVSLTVVSNSSWNAVVYDSRISLSQLQGGSGTTVITLDCSKNRELADRNFSIRFRATQNGITEDAYVYIEQEAADPFIEVTGGGNMYFDNSGSTWTVRYDTNLPQVYYELSGATGIIETGYTSAGRVSFELPPVTATTDYVVNFYDSPGGTLYDTATAEQTLYYFRFTTRDYETIPSTDTAYTVNWETNYESIRYVFSSTSTTTTAHTATFTFGPNTSTADTITYTMKAYNPSGRLVGTLHWIQRFDMGVYAGEYLTLDVLENGTLYFTDALHYHDQQYIEYSLDSGATWEKIMNGYCVDFHAGDQIMLRHTGTWHVNKVINGLKCNAHGNILSMVYGDDFASYSAGTVDNMFHGMDVVSAENVVLPIKGSYINMFWQCRLLTTAPSIIYCDSDTNCSWMFAECRSLVKAPIMRGKGGLYEEMFWGCTSLVNAPELPEISDTLPPGDKTFIRMFSGCTSLVNGPSVIVGSEADSWTCHEMFRDCTSLVNAPVIMIATLNGDSCAGMFRDCENLRYIKCMATLNNGATGGWVRGVAPTGTFVKASGVSWATGESGIPAGWTVVDA